MWYTICKRARISGSGETAPRALLVADEGLAVLFQLPLPQGHFQLQVAEGRPRGREETTEALSVTLMVREGQVRMTKVCLEKVRE